MILRCTDPADPHYPDWGGRGITVCERWSGPDGLANFVADVGMPPGPGYSLDREDNDGNYEPSNVRWATAHEQTRNRRSIPRVRLDLLLAACTEVGIPDAQMKEALALIGKRTRRRK